MVVIGQVAELAPQHDQQAEARSAAVETALEIAAFRPVADLVRATMHLVAADLAAARLDLQVLAEEAAWAAADSAVVEEEASEEEAVVVAADEAEEADVVARKSMPRKNK